MNFLYNDEITKITIERENKTILGEYRLDSYYEQNRYCPISSKESLNFYPENTNDKEITEYKCDIQTLREIVYGINNEFPKIKNYDRYNYYVTLVYHSKVQKFINNLHDLDYGRYFINTSNGLIEIYISKRGILIYDEKDNKLVDNTYSKSYYYSDINPIFSKYIKEKDFYVEKTIDNKTYIKLKNNDFITDDLMVVNNMPYTIFNRDGIKKQIEENSKKIEKEYVLNFFYEYYKYIDEYSHVQEFDKLFDYIFSEIEKILKMQIKEDEKERSIKQLKKGLKLSKNYTTN